MKHISIIISLLSLFASLSAYAAPETFTLDPNHTYVLWRINHFGFSNPSGKWLAEGNIVLDETKPQDSKVNVIIHPGDMITGLPKLDEHLKSKDFFDVVKFPTATFVSSKIDVTGKNTAKVYGVLTVHGVSKPIVLDVKLNKVGMSPITNDRTVGFTASTKLKRSDFGISAYLPGLGDDVEIDIEAEGHKAKEENKAS